MKIKYFAMHLVSLYWSLKK